MRFPLLWIGALAATLGASAALAQSSPPMVGDKPLLQVKPKQAKQAKDAKMAGPPKSIAVRLQTCLDIEDGSKQRLDCYDAVFPPKPSAKQLPPAKAVADCRLVKEQDDRLTCFNGFAESIPKLPR